VIPGCPSSGSARPDAARRRRDQPGRGAFNDPGDTCHPPRNRARGEDRLRKPLACPLPRIRKQRPPYPAPRTVLAPRANTLWALGDLAGARKLHEQTLEIRERVLGGEHPDTLQSRNNMAATLWALGDLASARKHHEQTLEIRERVLGGEHPSTTNST